MVDPRQRSKKRSNGNSGSRQRNYTFYLDENWDCPEVKNELHHGGVRFRIYKQDVVGNAGAEDTSFLPTVGKRGWILITADWRQRTRPREIEDMKRYRVRHFALPGNLGAKAMAVALVSAKNNIRACCRENEPFISANIARDGSVRLIRDRQGSLHDRGITKIYKKGKCKIVQADDASAV